MENKQIPLSKQDTIKYGYARHSRALISYLLSNCLDCRKQPELAILLFIYNYLSNTTRNIVYFGHLYEVNRGEMITNMTRIGSQLGLSGYIVKKSLNALIRNKRLVVQRIKNGLRIYVRDYNELIEKKEKNDEQ